MSFNFHLSLVFTGRKTIFNFNFELKFPVIFLKQIVRDTLQVRSSVVYFNDNGFSRIRLVVFFINKLLGNLIYQMRFSFGFEN